MNAQKLDRKELIKILTKHPNWSIIANVYSEVVPDDMYGYSYGCVDENYYIDDVWEGDSRVWSLDEALEDVLLFLEQEFPEKVQDTITLDPETGKNFKEFIKKLPWKKVIVLDVTTPDRLHGDALTHINAQ